MIHNRKQFTRSRQLRAIIGVLSRMLLLGALMLLLIGVVAYVALHVKPRMTSNPALAATATVAAQYPPGTREYFYWNQGQQQPVPEQPQQ